MASPETRAGRAAARRFVRFSAAAASAAAIAGLTGCGQYAMEYITPIPTPAVDDVVGEWVNDDNGGAIDFHADGSCTIDGIPARVLDGSATASDEALGAPASTDECSWEIVDHLGEPVISLDLPSVRTSMIVRGEDAITIGFILGDPDQVQRYMLQRQLPTLR